MLLRLPYSYSSFYRTLGVCLSVCLVQATSNQSEGQKFLVVILPLLCFLSSCSTKYHGRQLLLTTKWKGGLWHGSEHQLTIAVPLSGGYIVEIGRGPKTSNQSEGQKF